MLTLADIELFCQQVVETFHPHRIVLFGSYATGSARPDSDVDLLIEVEHEAGGCRSAAKIIRETQPRFGVDLIVRTRRDIARRLEQKDSFLEAVFRQGRVLYEAAD